MISLAYDETGTIRDRINNTLKITRFVNWFQLPAVEKILATTKIDRSAIDVMLLQLDLERYGK